MSNNKRQKNFEELEVRIDYKFSNYERLERALTHASTQNSNVGNYERLEFLGDRVLGLCIAEFLFLNFKKADQGELSVRMNNLVSARACARVADDINLHKYILTGSEIKDINGKNQLKMRADVMESLIATIYLDGGLEAAKTFILKFWSNQVFNEKITRRDAKTELQEWAHMRYKVNPSYKVVSREGPDHAPKFKVEVSVNNKLKATGQGSSKRQAELSAAKIILRDNGVLVQ